MTRWCVAGGTTKWVPCLVATVRTTGFSLDVKALAGVLAARPLRAAIRAPWRETADLRAAIAALRAQGETVVCALPGHDSEVNEFHCDRELIQVAGQWVVQAI